MRGLWTRRSPSILSLAVALLAGCVEPDLGDVPFFCNKGDPACPDGYDCVAGRCVRDGVSFDAETAVDLGPSPWGGDGSPPPQADAQAAWWDLGARPDTSAPTLDSGGPLSYPACQDQADCTVDPLNPCCCLGTCEPACLWPLCF